MLFQLQSWMKSLSESIAAANRRNDHLGCSREQRISSFTTNILPANPNETENLNQQVKKGIETS